MPPDTAMIRLLERTATWKFIVPLLALFGIFAFYLFPHYEYRIQAATGVAVKPLDLRWSYSRAEVVHDFSLLGASGRSLYKIVVGQVDMVYPLVYGGLLLSVLAYLLKKNTPAGSGLLRLALLPALGAGFDYLENLNTLGLLAHYPDIAPAAVARGELMTRMKFGVLALALALAFFLVVRLLTKAWTRKNRPHHPG